MLNLFIWWTWNLTTNGFEICKLVPENLVERICGVSISKLLFYFHLFFSICMRQFREWAQEIINFPRWSGIKFQLVSWNLLSGFGLLLSVYSEMLTIRSKSIYKSRYRVWKKSSCFFRCFFWWVFCKRNARLLQIQNFNPGICDEFMSWSWRYFSFISIYGGLQI